MTINKITVGDLKEFLKNIPDNHTIIISKDGEGNIFSPMSKDVSFGNYLEETPFLGDVEFDDINPSSIIIFPVC